MTTAIVDRPARKIICAVGTPDRIRRAVRRQCALVYVLAERQTRRPDRRADGPDDAA